MSNVGTVKSWSDERGFGFILPKVGGNDVFVHRKAIGMNASLVPSKEVRYDYQNEKGKPKATMVMGEGVRRNNMGNPGGFPAGGGGGYGGGAPMGGGGSKLQFGYVKSWVPQKGFGFLRTSNPENPSANPGDADIFVLSTQVRGTLVPGAKVTYTLGMNPKTQKPWAENVTMVNDGGLGGYGAAAAGYGELQHPSHHFYGGAAAAWQNPPPYGALAFPGY